MSEISPTAVVARNTAYQFLAKGMSVVLSMVTFSLITRSLTQDQFGSYTLISTIFAFMIGIADLRVDQAAVRQAAEYPDHLSRYAGQTSIVKTIFGLVVLLASGVVIYFSHYDHVIKLGIAVVGAGMLLTSIQSGFLVIVQHRLQVYWQTWAELVAKIVVAALIAITAWPVLTGQAPTNTTMYIYTGVQFVVSALTILLVYIYVTRRRMAATIDWRVDWREIKLLLVDTWPLWALGLLSLVHYRADTLILAQFKSTVDVAIYGLPYRLLDVVLTLPPLFTASVYPLFSQYAVSDRARADRALIKSFNFLLLFVVFLAIYIGYAASQFVDLFGGSQYIQSAGVLIILCGAMVGSFLGSLFATYAVAVRQQWLAVATLVMGVVVNVGLCIWLIPAHSYYGAAIATAVSELLGLLSLAIVLIYRHRLPISFMVVSKVAVTAVFCWGLVWLTGLANIHSNNFMTNVLLLAAIGIILGIAYLFLVLAMRIVDREILLEAVSTLPLPVWIRRYI